MPNPDKRKYLIFLDIDGVFASSRVHFSWDNEYNKWSKFDPVAVDFCNKIYDRYPVEFVLMSTWKEWLDPTNEMITHWVMTTFKNAGFRGKFADSWKTNPTNMASISARDRAYEVKDYLQIYATDIKDFILFDDNRFRFKEILGKNRLIQTNSDNGLTYKNMKDAHSLMGQWEPRGDTI